MTDEILVLPVVLLIDDGVVAAGERGQGRATFVDTGRSAESLPEILETVETVLRVEAVDIDVLAVAGAGGVVGFVGDGEAAVGCRDEVGLALVEILVDHVAGEIVARRCTERIEDVRADVIGFEAEAEGSGVVFPDDDEPSAANGDDFRRTLRVADTLDIVGYIDLCGGKPKRWRRGHVYLPGFIIVGPASGPHELGPFRR